MITGKKILGMTVVAGLSTLLFTGNAYAHEVKKGDTLFEIAREHDVPLDKLIEINGHIKNPNLIYVGDNINTDVTIVGKVAVKSEVNTESNVNIIINDKELLARLVQAEANGESFAGKVAVASVVLNRIDSNQFPNTVQGVIYERNQFSPVANGSINNTPNQDSIRAVDVALNNRTDYESLYFYNPSISNSKWFNTLTTTRVIGNHVFKK